MVVDLPLVPVMATNGECGASLRRSRQNNSTSPITSTWALFARTTDQCGDGWVSGTPGASSSAEIFDQSIVAQVFGGDAGRARLLEACRAVVERDHLGAARNQSLRAGEPRAAEPEQRDFLSSKAGDRDHRSLSVANPASASTIAMIQNRITICDSVQPSCSK